MKSIKREDVLADVEAQLDTDPEPGSLHYELVRMIDRYAPGGSAELPEGMEGKISDEKRLAYNRDFVKQGLSYLRTREGFPQVPVMLCKREIALIEQCLHIASMALQFHISPRHGMVERVSGKQLREALNEEVLKMRRLGRPTLLSMMPGLAAFSTYLQQQADTLPRRKPDDND